MSKALGFPPAARSWRNIPQHVKPRAMSREGHRRLVAHGLKIAGLVVFAVAVSWGIWETASALKEGPQGSPGAAVAAPVQNIEMVTDGVLDKAWLGHTLALPRKATLMDLDLGQLQGRLLASGQVSSASVVRIFPATLRVRISERAPVARILAQAGGSEPRALLVARDGAVYEGAGYDLPLLDSLPWLDGVKLARRDGRIAPIDGMDSVAELLARARMEAEPLYRTWHVVSLAVLTINAVLTVIGGLNAFTMIFALTGGGPGNATQTVTTLLFQNAFTFGRYGYGTAMACALSIVVAAIAFAQVKFLRGRELAA